MVTAAAAAIPCRVEPQPAPGYGCDCMMQAADRARVWDEGLMRAIRKYGIRYSTEVGLA